MSIKDCSCTAGKMSQEDRGWGVSTHVTDKVPSAPVTPAVSRTKTEGLLGLAGFQPSQKNMSPKFRERLCHWNKYSMIEGNVQCPLVACTRTQGGTCACTGT